MDLGPGLLESVYVTVLYRSLQRRGLQVERQKVVQFEFDGMLFEEGLRLDPSSSAGCPSACWECLSLGLPRLSA